MKKPHVPSFVLESTKASSSGVKIFGEEVSTAFSESLPLLLESQEVFRYGAYSEEIHLPVKIPHLDTYSLNRSYLRCLDMPLRLAGDNVYHIPEQWAGLTDLIYSIIKTEQSHNANWKDYFTYLTVDSKYVNAGEQQRHGGLHVDGFQGERIDPKTKITRNYVGTINGGTVFYNQKFNVVDPRKFNVFQGFDLQAEPTSQIVAEPDYIYFMNAYSVHESGYAARNGLRTFIRVTFDLKEFDREGNTHNPMINYKWPMFNRLIHEELTTPTVEDVANAKWTIK